MTSLTTARYRFTVYGMVPGTKSRSVISMTRKAASAVFVPCFPELPDDADPDRQRRLSRTGAQDRDFVERVGHFVVGSPIQFSAGEVFARPSPLLEEERHFCASALIMDRFNPLAFHRSCAGAGLSADNRPMNTVQGKLFYRADKRLTRKNVTYRHETFADVKSYLTSGRNPVIIYMEMARSPNCHRMVRVPGVARIGDELQDLRPIL